MLLKKIEKLRLVSVREEDDCVKLYFFWALPTAVAWPISTNVISKHTREKVCASLWYRSFVSTFWKYVTLTSLDEWLKAHLQYCTSVCSVESVPCCFLKTNTTTASPLTLLMSQSVIFLWWETVTIIVSEEIPKINMEVKRFGSTVKIFKIIHPR